MSPNPARGLAAASPLPPLAGDDPWVKAPPAPLSSKQQAGLSPAQLRGAAEIAAGKAQQFEIAALPRNRLEIVEIGAQLARTDAQRQPIDELLRRPDPVRNGLCRLEQRLRR